EPPHDSLVPPRWQARAGDRRRARHRACGGSGVGRGGRACHADGAFGGGNRGRGRGDPQPRRVGRGARARRHRFRRVRGRGRECRSLRGVRQQRRHEPAPALRRSDRIELRRDHEPQRARRLFRRAGRCPTADGDAASGLDHQHVVPARAGRRRRPLGLLRHEIRGRGVFEGDGAGIGRARHPGQHHLPDLHRDADDAALSGAAGGEGLGALEDQAWAHRPCRGSDGRDPVSRERCVGADDGLLARRRRRLDGGV
ncbi:MAG: Gluconate 5-dehydrogenase, partial [uncultured Microvirga sp.]